MEKATEEGGGASVANSALGGMRAGDRDNVSRIQLTGAKAVPALHRFFSFDARRIL